MTDPKQRKIDSSDTEEFESTPQEERVEAEGKEAVLSEPFDPNLIGIFRKPFTVDNVVKRIKRGSIVLAPAYQRREVWDDVKKSQLIESLLLKIPLPSFYVAEDDNGNYEVVDGQQRLSAIRDFYFSDGKVTLPHCAYHL